MLKEGMVYERNAHGVSWRQVNKSVTWRMPRRRCAALDVENKC